MRIVTKVFLILSGSNPTPARPFMTEYLPVVVRAGAWATARPFARASTLGSAEPRYRIGKSAVEHQNDSILDRLLLIEASWMDRGVNDILGEGVENRPLDVDIENSAVFIQRTTVPPMMRSE